MDHIEKNQPPHPAFIWLTLALGAALRFFHLGQESFWQDEVTSVQITHQTFSGMMQFVVNYDSHPPLYYVLLHFWIQLFGTSEGAVRLLSAGFGAASVGLMYVAGRTLFDARTGLYAALFLALSPFHLYYSQEARLYCLFGSFSLLIMISLWEVSRNGSYRWQVLLVLSSLGALLTQNLAMILILIQNVWYLCTRRAQVLKGTQWLKLQAVILGLFLFWVPFLLKQVAASKQVGFLSWIQLPTFAHLAELLLEFCGAFPIYSSSEPTFWYFLGSGIPALLFLIFTFFPVVTELKQRLYQNSQSPFSAAEKNLGGFLALWFLLPILLPFFASHLFFPIFIVRACIPALFVVFFVLAWGVSVQPKFSTRLLLSGLIIGASLGNIWLYDSLTVKSDWRQAASTLDQKLEPQGQVFFFPAYIIKPFEFYSSRSDLQKAVLPLTGDSPQEFRNHLIQSLSSRRQFWLVTAYLQEDVERLAEGLSHLFRLETTLDFPGIQAYQFRF